MSFSSSFPQPQPPNDRNPISQLPADFDQPDKPRPGTAQSGKYSPWDLFKDYKPTEAESMAAKGASRAFIMYWLPGTALGLAASAWLARSGKLREYGLGGNAMMIGAMLSGELVGRKMGEAAGTQVLLRDLPSDSKLRAAIEQFQRTGHMDPSVLQDQMKNRNGDVEVAMRRQIEARLDPRLQTDSQERQPTRQERPTSSKRRPIVEAKEEQFGTADPDADLQAKNDLLYSRGAQPPSRDVQAMGQEQSGFLRTAEDWERAEKTGKVHRNAYGDIIE